MLGTTKGNNCLLVSQVGDVVTRCPTYFTGGAIGLGHAHKFPTKPIPLLLDKLGFTNGKNHIQFPQLLGHGVRWNHDGNRRFLGSLHQSKSQGTTHNHSPNNQSNHFYHFHILVNKKGWGTNPTPTGELWRIKQKPRWLQ
jgi:hypothetical protein